MEIDKILIWFRSQIKTYPHYFIVDLSSKYIIASSSPLENKTDEEKEQDFKNTIMLLVRTDKMYEARLKSDYYGNNTSEMRVLQFSVPYANIK